MNKLYQLLLSLSFLCLLLLLPAAGQEKMDSAMVAKIKDEGMNRSQVMDILSYISDVYGPRLAGSPEYKRAAEWAREKMTSIGLENAHLDPWGPLGKGWTLKHYEANVMGLQDFPLLSYPKAWSPGVKGTADIIYLDLKADSTLESFKGKLKGKYVMLGNPVDLKAHFAPDASREPDSSLLNMANAGMPQPRGRRNFQMNANDKRKAMVTYNAWNWCMEEGALAVLTPGRGDFGTVFVSAYDPKAPKILPQIQVAAEHYNRLVRMMSRGVHPKLDLNLQVEFTDPDSTFDIIGEIPGSDLKDQVVMIGAHFDSWHGGTGATDNGTGSAVCLEAMRILKASGLSPRRTIRIGLWGGEEEGLLGSEAYVKKHLGEAGKGGTFMNPTTEPPTLKQPAADNFDVYFNNDNGSGKVRGIYMQGNEATRPIFREWLSSFKDMGASTISLSNTARRKMT